MDNIKKVNNQSVGEEIANAISHGAGSLLSIAGTAVIIVYACINSDLIGIVSAALFGASLIILYTASTLYHSFTNQNVKRVFQIFDHCSIYILILGTYIPLTLSLLGGTAGWVLFSVNAVCAVLGIVFNSINLHKWRNITMALYIVMGWSVVLAAYPISQRINLSGALLLILGGLSYTIGLYFYKNKRRYFHFIWHFFVLGGSIFHFFFVMFYCL